MVSLPVAVPARGVSVAAPVAAAAPAPSALAPAQTGNILPEMAWSAHDATNAILSAREVPADANPNSFEKWGMANCKRKAIYKMWKDHVKANTANLT